MISDSISGVDETNQYVYVNGNKDNYCEKHLFRLSYNQDTSGNDALKITMQPGWHQSKVCVIGGYYIDIFSSLTSPSVTSVTSLTDLNNSVILLESISTLNTQSKLVFSSLVDSTIHVCILISSFVLFLIFLFEILECSK